MKTLTFKGQEISAQGHFPSEGDSLPDFTMIGTDLAEVTLSSYAGKILLLNIFPSVDTPVCEIQLRTFSEKLGDRDDVVLAFASLDLPFAFKRFCAAEGIDNAVTLSDYRHRSLAENYGVQMKGGPLDGLYARAVLVADADGKIIYSELVPEVTDEPNYEEALRVVSH